jgi:hypothetical protein
MDPEAKMVVSMVIKTHPIPLSGLYRSDGDAVLMMIEQPYCMRS